MKAFWRYLVHGSEDLTLPKEWLANTQRLRIYEGYTRRQLLQGSITKDVAAMRREAFWQAVEDRAVASQVAEHEGRGRCLGLPRAIHRI